jgi:hypothetical protein
MTATQSLKISEISHKHFKNDADAKTVVQEIEVIIYNKFDKEKNSLATKEDIYLFKEDFYKFQTDVEKRFNANILWTVGTGVAIVGLIFTMVKMFLVK